jgi:hypothetical protein
MVIMFWKRSTAHVINLSRSHKLSEYRNSLDPLIQFINTNSVTMTFNRTSYTHAYIPELFPYIKYMEKVSGKHKQKEFRNRLGQNFINPWTEEEHWFKKRQDDVDYETERERDMAGERPSKTQTTRSIMEPLYSLTKFIHNIKHYLMLSLCVIKHHAMKTYRGFDV